jgi:hypothetical protein
MDRLRFGVLLGLCLVTLTLEARPLTATDVPKPLEPWVDWVLKGHEERTCPFPITALNTTAALGLPKMKISSGLGFGRVGIRKANSYVSTGT